MKTVYYSEKLKKHYDSEEECQKAELEYDKKYELERVKKEQRAAEAKEVEDAFKKANEAYKEAREKLNTFVDKYGSFHTTFNEVVPLDDLWTDITRLFWL